MIEHILLGVDGSQHGRAALQWTLQLAELTGSRVTVVCAFDEPWSFHRAARSIVDGPPDELEDEARQIAAEAAGALTAAGLSCVPIAFEGTFVQAVLSLSGQERPDLVVVGSGGEASARAHLLGSTAERVVRMSPVPVLVVR